MKTQRQKRGQLRRREGTRGSVGAQGWWGLRRAPHLPAALLTTRRGPRATSGHAAASPRPRRRSPTCHWRPPSARPAPSGPTPWAGQRSDLRPPPSQPPTWGARVPEEAHLLAAEPRHPGVGARGAKQAPRALCLVEHREPSVRRADLHCRARGPPGSPSRPSPPGLFSARASLVPSPGRPDQSTLRSARL